MKSINLMLVVASALFVSSAFAGTCEIGYTRTACPGRPLPHSESCRNGNLGTPSIND